MIYDEIKIILDSPDEPEVKRKLADKFHVSYNWIHSIKYYFHTKYPDDREFIKKRMSESLLLWFDRYAGEKAGKPASNAAAAVPQETPQPKKFLTQEDVFAILQAPATKSAYQALAARYHKSATYMQLINDYYRKYYPVRPDRIKAFFGSGMLEKFTAYAQQNGQMSANQTKEKLPVPPVPPAASNAAAAGQDQYARYTHLKQAQDNLDSALVSFIEQEVTAQTKEKERAFTQQLTEKDHALVEQLKAKDAKIAELEKTITRLNAEATKYQEAFVEARNSNWVDILRKRFNGSPNQPK